jgi:hypothetical protein
VLKAKRVKVLTHRSKPIGTVEVPKLIESAKTGLLATETAPVVPNEASAGSVKEPGPKKTAEDQPKLLSCPTVTELSNVSATATMTPRKRRMASILDAILESVKTPTPASTEASGEKIEDAREAVTASASSVHAETGSSEAAPVKLVGESLLEKPTTSVPEAPPRAI